MMNTPYYQASLQVPSAAKLAVMAGAIATLPFAWLYAWGTTQLIPIVNPLCTLIMACSLAVLSKKLATAGRVRHPVWMGRAGAAVGCFAWYAQWAAWIAMNDHLVAAAVSSASTPETVLRLFVRPDLMATVAVGIVQDSSSMVARSFFILVWLSEFATFLLLPRIAGARRASAPFCEQTEQWAREIVVPVAFRFIDEPDVVRRRLEHNPEELVAVLGPPIDESARYFSEVSLFRCGGDASFVTITNLAAMVAEENPVPALKNLSQAMPGKLECVAQVDDPVVELLRVPVGDPDLMLRQWEDAASGLPERAVSN